MRHCKVLNSSTQFVPCCSSNCNTQLEEEKRIILVFVELLHGLCPTNLSFLRGSESYPKAGLLFDGAFSKRLASRVSTEEESFTEFILIQSTSL